MGGCCGKLEDNGSPHNGHSHHSQRIKSSRKSQYDYYEHQPSAVVDPAAIEQVQPSFHQTQTTSCHVQSSVYHARTSRDLLTQPSNIFKQQQSSIRHNIGNKCSTAGQHTYTEPKNLSGNVNTALASQKSTRNKSTDIKISVQDKRLVNHVPDSTKKDTLQKQLVASQRSQLTQRQSSKSQKYLKALQKLAEEFITIRRCRMIQIYNLYRNLPSAIFDRIKQFENGVMETRLKDNHGDPMSPINGKIKGLFFMATHQRDGTTPDRSPFGERRCKVPIDRFFKGTRYNLYFTDFYCNGPNRPHYVTLVLTKSGSDADRFCSNNAVILDITDNPFFTKDDWGCLSLAGGGLWIEVFYTHRISLTEPGSTWETVEIIGKGKATKKGFPKDPNCDVCNIQT